MVEPAIEPTQPPSPPPTPPFLPANQSFYLSMQVFAGIMFGAFEYSWMQAQILHRVDVLLFLFASTLPLVFMLLLKRMKIMKGRRMFVVARSYWHIVADFFFAGTTAGTLSILIYIYSNGYAIFDQKTLELTRHGGIILINIILYITAVATFSIIAKAERQLVAGDS